jgi:hypothetical protein
VVVLRNSLESWAERLSAAIAEERVTCMKVGRPCWTRRMAGSLDSVSMAAAAVIWRAVLRT